MKQAFLLIIFAVMSLSFATALQTDLISTAPAPVTAGEYADITVRITALPSQATQNNVLVGVQENQYVTAITQPRNYASIRPGDQVTATFRVYINQDAPEGVLNLLTFIDTGRGQSVTEHELFVQGAQRQADLRTGRITTVPQQLLPDSKRNELTITLQNLGERAAELVTAELQIAQGAKQSYAYSLQDSVASVAGGAQEPLTFTFDIRAHQRESMQAELHLEYRTRREGVQTPSVQTRIIPVTIPLADAPFLEISAQELRTQSTQGSSDNVLRITIENTGAEEAVDVRVRLFPDVSFPFIFERTSQYAGAKIAPGQNTTLDIKYEVVSSASVRDYEILVELESLVATTRYTQTDTITIPVREGSGISIQAIAGILIALIIVLALVIGLVRRKKK